MTGRPRRGIAPAAAAIANAEGLVGHAKAMEARREPGLNTPASPRPGLREVGPYDSPQLEVAVRLNTNECPLPLPVGFSDDLAAAVRELPLNRYPDGQMLALRAALAQRTGHAVDGVWTANGSNEILTQLLWRTAARAGGRSLFEPTYSCIADSAGSRRRRSPSVASIRRSRSTTMPSRGPPGRAPTSCSSARQQSDRQHPAPRRDPVAGIRIGRRS